MGSRDTYSSKSDGFEPIAIVGMGKSYAVMIELQLIVFD